MKHPACAAHWLGSAVVAAVLLSGASSLCLAGGITALTKPSKNVSLSCSRPGLIADVLVNEGDAVKAGQPVVQQDDREEQAALEADKAKAEDETRIGAQHALLEQSKVDLMRTEWGFQHGGANQFEYDKAKVDVVVAEAQETMAKQEKRQAELKYRQSKVIVEKMRLVSPIDGIVTEIMAHPGESVELSTKVIRIVKLDPLWIDVAVPRDQARAVKLDQPAQVTFSDKTAATGKVTVIFPVGEGATDKLTIRVELPNPELRQSGEKVTVDFAAPAPVAQAVPAQ